SVSHGNDLHLGGRWRRRDSHDPQEPGPAARVLGVAGAAAVGHYAPRESQVSRGAQDPAGKWWACVVSTRRIICRFALSNSGTVIIHVPGALRAYCGGAEQLETSALTIRAGVSRLAPD